MDKAYEPQKHEDAISKKWEKAGIFIAKAPEASRTKKSFTVPLPPPNVTGQLHLGHAEMLVVEDIMCRYHRMKGDATLWIPGTDHAAIATETVVLKNLGIKERDKEISREKFIAECWKWTAKSHDTIVTQIKKMGASCDWTRERFTMDFGMSNAVNTIFYDLFQAGLIYRGNRLINWSVGAQSVLSDDEVIWEERDETLYYIKCGEFVIATVRPETKCSDSPVVVNPKDKRYKHLIGKEFEYETYAGKRKFFVLADASIDLKFGTGAMTISTAHDAHDFEIAQRHNLPYPQKIGFDGRMTELAGPCAGLTVAEARRKSVEIMKEKGLIVKEEPYRHRVPICYRTATVVEPMISRQWFIDVNKEFVHPILKKKTTLKKLTAEAVRGGAVKIIPQRFEKIYFHWIDNLRDWCISRQIWWGHRIPVWYETGDRTPNSELRTQSGGGSRGSGEGLHFLHKQQLIFARHGECVCNAEGKMASRNDSPFTAKGRKQAEKLAERLQRDHRIKKIITSSLSRARQSAEILAEKLNLPLEIWDELVEVDVGKFTNEPDPGTSSILEAMVTHKTGETMEELNERARKVWKRIAALKPQDGEIAFFGHSCFTAILFAVRDGVTPEKFPAYEARWHFENGAIRETTLMLPPAGKNLQQDSDTLDTWFSSALWPFSTLGWPDTENPDYRHFFPTSVLETGHDILFFWVARMIMFSLFATGKIPFHTVYLHGLVCDEKGQKMSKSKGNGIDPLDMIRKFGTDALRMSMIVGTSPGNPINLGEKKVEAYRNFANKLWNVARFILFQLPAPTNRKIQPQRLTERWILSKTQRLISEVTAGIEQHKYGEVGQKLYEFTWSDLADWAIEAVKADASKNAPFILRDILATLLKLLHPYTPFVTEKIWEEMKMPELLAISSWPEAGKQFIDQKAKRDFEFLQHIVMVIRSLRSAKKVDPAKHIPAVFTGKNLKVLRENEAVLKFLARLGTISYKRTKEKGASAFVGETEIVLPLAAVLDKSKERGRLQKELETAEKFAANLKTRLENKEYVQNAPPKLVAASQAQYREAAQKVSKLRAELSKYQ